MVSLHAVAASRLHRRTACMCFRMSPTRAGALPFSVQSAPSSSIARSREPIVPRVWLAQPGVNTRTPPAPLSQQRAARCGVELRPSGEEHCRLRQYCVMLPIIRFPRSADPPDALGNAAEARTTHLFSYPSLPDAIREFRAALATPAALSGKLEGGAVATVRQAGTHPHREP